MTSQAETPMSITHMIARFVSQATYGDIPAEALEIAKRCFVDGTAVMLAGSTEPCARIARAHVREIAGTQEASTIGQDSMRAPAPLAAFVNGIAGHALDWDDTALSLEKDRSVLIHPTMQPLCAIYAVAEALGTTGKDMLLAFSLGFEVQVKIAEAIHPDHFTGGRGFHSTGTIGVFGAAVAASKLMRLSEGQITHALAVAATTASGLGANHGTMSKPLNMGRAAEAGVTAARLARLGFDGPRHALEGGRGFFEAFGGGFVPERIVGRLGRPWALVEPGTSVKPYPSGVVGHPGMDAMKALVSAHDITADQVDRVIVRTGPNVIDPGPLRIDHASTALEGKFCVPFQMAAIILRRKAGLAEFSDDFARSQACQDLQRRVETVIDPQIAALGKAQIVFDIELRTRDGRSFTQRSQEHYRGGPLNPLTWNELADKFHDCATPLMDHHAIDQALSRIGELESQATVGPLVDLLTVAA